MADKPPSASKRGVARRSPPLYAIQGPVSNPLPTALVFEQTKKKARPPKVARPWSDFQVRSGHYQL